MALTWRFSARLRPSPCGPSRVLFVDGFWELMLVTLELDYVCVLGYVAVVVDIF